METTVQSKRGLRSIFRSFSEVDMLHGPIFKSLVTFAIPIFVSMLFQNLYNTVDSLIVGRVWVKKHWLQSVPAERSWIC